MQNEPLYFMKDGELYEVGDVEFESRQGNLKGVDIESIKIFEDFYCAGRIFYWQLLHPTDKGPEKHQCGLYELLPRKGTKLMAALIHDGRHEGKVIFALHDGWFYKSLDDFGRAAERRKGIFNNLSRRAVRIK